MFGWRDYLAFAETLVRPTVAEAGWRTAASRAYYAAFHVCREAIEESTGPLGQEKVHAAVRQHLRERAGREDTARTLERLWKLRAHADYNSREFSLSSAKIAVVLASQLVSRPI